MTDSKSLSAEWGSLTSGEFQSNEKWWPNALNLRILHQHHPDSTPFDRDFKYREQFSRLDVDELTRDVDALMTDSKEWWPADWGHYGPFFIRMSWHAAGTYRVNDGRGGGGTGAQRYAPLNSWPDNGNLDKARRLLLPIKQKYGKRISWADLFVFAGNRALETMGFTTAGFSFGRDDIWAPEDDIYWGPENEWLSINEDRYTGSWEDGSRALDNPLAAVQMGLIYVNPEGPNGIPDAMRSAQDIRETFGRMAMNDEETVALTVGGHTFGKMHGAVTPDMHGPEPEAASIADQGIGWANSHETGFGEYTLTSGLEGAWTPTPTKWDNMYLETIFAHEWELVESPAGAKQWQPREVKEGFMVPDAHVEGKMTPPTMSTADMAMITDPAYLEISKRFYENPDQLADAFAKAWFKLLHRDMGPAIRYVGPQVPGEEFLWQDNVPAHEGPMIGDAEIAELKSTILGSGLGTDQLVRTAWASASTYRRTDFRGGANGARIRLSPMSEWDVNVQSGVNPVISKLDEIRRRIQRQGWRPGVARRHDRARRYRSGGSGCEGCRPRRHGAVHAGSHRRLPGRHRHRLVPVARAERRRVPQLRPQVRFGSDRAPADRQGVHAQPDGAADDGTRRRLARDRQQRR
jgi:catalase-peroxidase